MNTKLIHSMTRRLGAVLLAAAACAAWAGDTSKGYDVILLVGQSNMAAQSGPDPVDDPDGVAHDAIKMWDPTNGIVTAKDPINHQKQGSGVGMGLAFAKSYLYWLRNNGYPNRKVLLVGAAYGGTGFTSDNGVLYHPWMAIDTASTDHPTEGSLYRGALKRANAAMFAAITRDDPTKPESPTNPANPATARFVAILWHQGEADIDAGGGDSYAKNHTALVKALREKVTGAANAPVVVGEMAPCRLNSCITGTTTLRHASDIKNILKYFHQINLPMVPELDYTTVENKDKPYKEVVNEYFVPGSAWVSSAGLVSINNGSHFDGVSQRELGRRYFAKFLEAREGLPSPAVELKSFNGKFFNVGTTIDDDYLNFRVPRRDGNVNVSGEVAAVLDSAHGHVAQITQGRGRLSLVNASKELFNASYTKMAWVKVNNLSYGNNSISGLNPNQSHYVFTPSSGLWTAGHSTVTARVNKFVQAPSKVPLDEWAHVAVSYDAALQQMNLYINGQLVDSASKVPAATPAYDAVELEIPGRKEAVSGGLHGSVSSVRVYKTPLTATQVNAIFTAERDAQTGYGRVLRPAP